MLSIPPATPLIEHWKPVIDCEQHYEVSSLGAVRRTVTGKRLKPRPNEPGYLRVELQGDRKRWFRKVHCLVAEAFLGARPNGMQVNHTNGQKDCNRLSNLEYVTQHGNLRHCQILGLNKTWKLSDREVMEIISLKGEMTTRQIASLYDTTSPTVSRIHTGKQTKLRVVA